MITKDNYEAFILDYYEGRLSAEATAELMLFLESHPECKEAFEDFESTPSLTNEEITFSEKNTFKKTILGSEDFIGYIENTISELEKEKIENAIKEYPGYQKELLLYKKTILTPEQIIFTEKKSLKRETKKVIPLYYYVSAAASVVLLISLFFLLDNNDKPPLATKNNSRNDTVLSSSPKNVHPANSEIALNNDSVKTNAIVRKLIKREKYTKETIVLENNVIAQTATPVIINDSANAINTPSVVIVKAQTSEIQPTQKVYYEEEIIVAANTTKASSNEYISVGAHLSRKLFGVKKHQGKTKPGNLYYAASLLRKAGSKKIKTNEEYDGNNNLVAYTVAYKNLEFSKKR